MTPDEELVVIERERLSIEKQRDKNTKSRFIFGSVLIVILTTGLSAYINLKQEKRALVNNQKQMVFSTLREIAPEDFDEVDTTIDDLFEIGLEKEVIVYLRNRKAENSRSKLNYETVLAEEAAALEEAERKRLAAVEAKLKAELVAVAADKQRLDREAEEAELASELADRNAAIAQTKKLEEIKRIQKSIGRAINIF